MKTDKWFLILFEAVMWIIASMSLYAPIAFGTLYSPVMYIFECLLIIAVQIIFISLTIFIIKF